MVQHELALLQEGPSDSDDTMADDSDEPLGQDLGLQFGGFDMQPEDEPPNKTVSIPYTHASMSSTDLDMCMSVSQTALLKSQLEGWLQGACIYQLS